MDVTGILAYRSELAGWPDTSSPCNTDSWRREHTATQSIGQAASGYAGAKNERIYRALGGLAIFYACLMTFSLQFESLDQANSRLDYIAGPKAALKPGIDESWAWALNAVTQTNYIFGKDVVFTYGPLGFLMSPRPIGHNFQWASCFAVCIRVILSGLLGVFALEARTRRGFLLFLAGSVVASAIGLWDEYLYRLVIGLCLLVACLTSPFAIAACVMAGVLAPILLLIKFSIGLTSVSMMVVATLILAFRQTGWRRIFALWFSAALALSFWIFVLFGNAGNFRRWLALSWEVASGYGAAMSIAGPPGEAIVGILLLAVLVLSAVLLKGIAAMPSLLFAIPAAMALKHGFVGHAGMAMGYFTFMVAVASVVFLFVKTRAEWRLAGCLWALMFAVAIYKGVFLIAWPPITLEDVRHHLSGQLAIQALRNAWDSKKLALELQTESARHLAPERLPARWDTGLRALIGGVDVFPWELSYLPANDLPWNPSFILQHYQADTHSIDQAMAERLGSRSGPSALLIEFLGFSGRHMLLDTPLAFRQILACYEPVETDYSRNLLWIRRRVNGCAPGDNLRLGDSARIRFGEWVTPPKSAGKLFAQLFLKPNAVGSIRQILWKTSPVYLRLEYEKGDTAEFRILPATASGGVLINYLPRSLQDLADLMAGYAFSKVARFQVLGPGASAFQRDFEVNWISDNSPFVDYSHVERVSSPEVVSVIPDSSGQQARMVTITARDSDGYRRLKFVQMIVRETNTSVDACYLRYDLDNRVLWMMDASGNGSTGVGMLGSLQVLENAKCSVNLAESWPEFRRDTVALHLSIALKPKVRVAQRVFARAIDESGNASPLAEYTSWKPAAEPVQENPWSFPPSPPTVSVESKKLAGHEKYSLIVHANDINGADDIDAVEVIVNNIVDGRHSCHFRYERKANAVSLMNDAGTDFTPPAKLGSPKQLSNSYCSIAAPDSPLVRGLYDVYFSFEVVLTEKMLNKKTIFLSAVDREGLRQNWRVYAPLP
jgi:hypothetical protein